MRDTPAGSVATATRHDDRRRLQTVFQVALFTTTFIKIVLAATLAPFVDEAFYWQESRHLAFVYTDLPPLTAWLIAAGEALFGHGTLAMRAPFVLIGALLPLLVARIARRVSGDAALGWQAGLWTLAMPLTGTLGVLALPDVPLTALSLLALDRFARAAREDRIGDWLLLGLLLALAWLTHLRAGMLWLAGLAFLLAHPHGRRLWRSRGLWIALIVGLGGLLPMGLIDPGAGADGLRFQAIDRHPWHFHADALMQPLEQALLVTPLLYGLLLATAVSGLRRADAIRDEPLLIFAATFLGGYFVLGLFADAERFRVHWPLPGYLPLLALLPLALQRWKAAGRRIGVLRAAAMALAVAGTLAAYAYLALAAHPAGAGLLRSYKAFPEHLVGWDEAGATLRGLLADPALTGRALVADNFMLAAELDFQLDGTRVVYVLDHPLNAKHGRAAQLAIWRRDEPALLQALREREIVLAVEETAGREREQVHWLAGLCRRVTFERTLARVDLHEGRKRIAFHAARVGGAAAPGCAYPPHG